MKRSFILSHRFFHQPLFHLCLLIVTNWRSSLRCVGIYVSR